MLIILEYERKDFVTMSVGPLHDNCRSICSAVTWLIRNPRCCRKNMCMYMVEVLVCYFAFSYPMNGMVAFGKRSF